MRTKLLVRCLSTALLYAGIQLAALPVGADTMKFQELLDAAKKEKGKGKGVKSALDS